MPLQTLSSFQEAFLSGKSLQKNFIHFSEQNCQELDIWIGRICRTVSLEFLHEILFTILNELLVNGCKANAKRIFFKSQSLTITNPKDYSVGIPKFKHEFGYQRNRIFQELEKTDLTVFVEAQNFPHFIQFRVTNNSKILDEERQRIESRITSSVRYKNISDAYSESIDSEESSGLGIVLIHILLRNSGIKDKFFELETTDDETTITIRIPKLLIPPETQNQIRNLLVNEVAGLPPLAPQIQKLIQEARSKDMDWNGLSKTVQKEPAITAEILKVSNSALFGSHTKVVLIVDALKRIGIRNLESIFLTLGARKILNGRYHSQLSVWSHSIRTSMYSLFLGEEVSSFSKYAEVASIGGLLHDLGRMILLSLDLAIVNQIRIFRSDSAKEISEWVEEYMLGITHSDIGLLLGKKWNFPDEILDIIKYHHKPWQCKSKNLPYCQMIYLSDILAGIKQGKGNYFTVEPEILQTFGIQSENEFHALLVRFQNRYESHRMEFEELI